MPNTTGSFAGPIGGAQIIKNAMMARGAAGSPLGQISPTAPGFNPLLAAQGPVPMPPGGVSPIPIGGTPTPMGGAPMPVQPTQAPPPPPQQPQPQKENVLFGDPQEKIIVQALIKQLDRLDKAKTIALGGGGAGILY